MGRADVMAKRRDGMLDEVVFYPTTFLFMTLSQTDVLDGGGLAKGSRCSLEKGWRCSGCDWDLDIPQTAKCDRMAEVPLLLLLLLLLWFYCIHCAAWFDKDGDIHGYRGEGERERSRGGVLPTHEYNYETKSGADNRVTQRICMKEISQVSRTSN